MRLTKKVLAIFMAVMVCFTALAGCNKGGKSNEEVTKITFWGANSQYDTKQYKELVDNYNKGQGLIDNVYVQYSPKGSDYSSNLSGVLSGKLAPTVCVIYDKYFKMYAAAGLLTDLEPYVNDKESYTYDADGNQNFDLSDIYEVNVYRYRYDKENNTAAGNDSSLYALPNGCNPAMLFYNASYFEAADINIISVAQEDLEQYNKDNGTKYMPHGYAEYAVSAAPAEGLKTSKTIDGKTVVKVFNNQIAMNWSELVCLSRYFTAEYNSDVSRFSANLKYGFLSEWWFPFGWSVGGDCIQWDESKNGYVFTLGSDNTNYLATKDTQVNGNAYSAGQILSYNDALTVTGQNDSLYALPSQLDAFTQFCRLYQKTTVSGEMQGYGIAPDPSTISGSRQTFFMSGKCAMIMENYNAINTISTNMSDEWNIAPAWQYREYEGGDLVGELSGKNGTLKVIGETYDGVVYTGELKKVNDTEVVGAKACSSLNYGISIAEKATEEEKAAAWKFVQYLAGKQGQSILGTANGMIPNGISYCNSEAYLSNASMKSKNLAAAVAASSYNTIMDECYLENQSWVDYWADILNTDVRGGRMSLTEFFATVTDRVNSDLSEYEVRLLRR